MGYGAVEGKGWLARTELLVGLMVGLMAGLPPKKWLCCCQCINTLCASSWHGLDGFCQSEQLSVSCSRKVGITWVLLA